MANNYKKGKWSGTLVADFRGKITDDTSLDEAPDYDTELANLKKAQAKIKGIFTKINKQVDMLEKHNETGKMATSSLGVTKKRMQEIQTAMDNNINGLISGISKIEREEYRKAIKWMNEMKAAQSANKSSDDSTPKVSNVSNETNKEASNDTSNSTEKAPETSNDTNTTGGSTEQAPETSNDANATGGSTEQASEASNESTQTPDAA